MNHADHVELLRKGGIQSGQVWADFGAGEGAFTLALAELLGDAGTIFAVDRDARALALQQSVLTARFPSITMHYLGENFTRPIHQLPALNGIVMANALHFANNPVAVVSLLRNYLRPEGRLIVVEYNTDTGNQWVPHPFSYKTWVGIAMKSGFAHTQQIGLRPSRFLGEIYSAVSW